LSRLFCSRQGSRGRGRRLRLEGLLEQAGLVRIEVKVERGGSSRRGHLRPGLPQRVDDLVFGGTPGQLGQLVFQEDQAEGVFQNTAFPRLEENFSSGSRLERRR